MAGIAAPSLIVFGALCAACGSASPTDRAVAMPVVTAPASAAASSPAPAPAFASAFAATSTSSPVPVLVADPAPAPTSTARQSAARQLLPATATIDDPAFDGGEVPKAKTSIEKLKSRVEKCVNGEGGVPSDGASIKLQFLVRAQGIAEGVDVLDARNIGEKAGRCIRDAFKKKKVGAPSTDPVGVTVTIAFTAKEPS